MLDIKEANMEASRQGLVLTMTIWRRDFDSMRQGNTEHI